MTHVFHFRILWWKILSNYAGRVTTETTWLLWQEIIYCFTLRHGHAFRALHVHKLLLESFGHWQNPHQEVEFSWLHTQCHPIYSHTCTQFQTRLYLEDKIMVNKPRTAKTAPPVRPKILHGRFFVWKLSVPKPIFFPKTMMGRIPKLLVNLPWKLLDCPHGDISGKCLELPLPKNTEEIISQKFWKQPLRNFYWQFSYILLEALSNVQLMEVCIVLILCVKKLALVKTSYTEWALSSLNS